MIDIRSDHLEIVKQILEKHLAGYEVWAFGSRITGKAKKFSDLDLVVITTKPLPTLTIALLKENFSESDLPFKVDVLDWSTISDEFKRRIKQKYEVIK